MADRVILTVGTKKGVFVADAAKPRRSFALRGPFGPGVPVYSTLIDARGTPRLYASSCNPFFGMKVLRSTDMGKSFTETKSAPAFPKEDGRSLANIWALEAGSGKKDLWCGVEPASLFRSRDGAIRGTWCPASATTIMRASGNPAAAASACTRSFATGIACTSASRPVATI